MRYRLIITGEDTNEVGSISIITVLPKKSRPNACCASRAFVERVLGGKFQRTQYVYDLIQPTRSDVIGGDLRSVRSVLDLK